MHAPGNDPDRVLLIGAGGAAGYGVLTHELGLGGHLARAISAITNRGVDLELCVAGRLTARTAAEMLLSHSPTSMDAVVIALGSIEAMDGDSAATWRTRLTVLLNLLGEWAAPSTITVIGIFPPSSVAWLPAFYEHAVARNALELNRVTREVTKRMGAKYLDFRPESEPFVQAAGRTLYEEWALQIAPSVAVTLVPSTTGADDERVRNATANAIESDVDPRMDSITAAARRLFGTQSAAVTIVGADDQRIKSAAGMSSETIPRVDAICNVTIQRSRALVIENLPARREFRGLPWVSGARALRFYAGYPIESASGHRVGALCVMDSESRRFTRSDTALLRELAFQAQTVLNS